MYKDELVGLSKAGVKYLTIGGIALGLHGYPRATFDLDIMPELSEDNLDKIIVALQGLGYIPRIPVDVRELKDPQKRELWHVEKNMQVFSFIKPQELSSIVDMMIYHPLPFDACFERRQNVYIEGVPIYIASLEDLLKLKMKANREKDKSDIAILERMLERRRDD